MLLFAILAVSVWIAIRNPITHWPLTLGASRARLITYVEIPLLPAIWVAVVWWGMRRRASMASFFGAGEKRRRWIADVALGLAGLVVWLAVSAVLSKVLVPTADQLRGLAVLLPHSSVERWVWLAAAPLAGVLEEMVYRGYLLRQFRAFTGSGAAAIVLQALAYGLAHLVLQAPMLISIALLGAYLGLLSVWRRSLIPAMVVHVGVACFAATFGSGPGPELSPQAGWRGGSSVVVVAEDGSKTF